ncbi:MAG: FkbM family methyltransferase [Candidatus Omnitrophica bacterium]|nr:FkbM family methyltransferase [Candidatus Omnitrophota bacterium]MBD3269105.1 FkbM family methyltransferase [Candidatus Omnitrophota bacterium]
MNFRKTLNLFLFDITNFLARIKADKIIPARLVYAIFSPFKGPQDTLDFYGNKLILNFNDRLYYNIFKSKDSLSFKLINKEIEPGGRVVDVGAHIGCYTLVLAGLVGSSGKVYSFEPAEDNFELLRKNIELNDYGNVIAVRKAVGNRTGQTRLYMHSKGVSHSIYSAEDKKRYAEVDILRLDEYFKDSTEGVDFVKIDAEGAEYDVLRGAENLLNVNPYIKMVVEYSPFMLKKAGTDHRDFLKFLKSLGFRLYDINEKKERVEATSVEDLLSRYKVRRFHYTNLFCVKAEGRKSKQPLP